MPYHGRGETTGEEIFMKYACFQLYLKPIGKTEKGVVYIMGHAAKL